jgi:hypothetical protein
MQETRSAWPDGKKEEVTKRVIASARANHVGSGNPWANGTKEEQSERSKAYWKKTRASEDTETVYLEMDLSAASAHAKSQCY